MNGSRISRDTSRATYRHDDDTTPAPYPRRMRRRTTTTQRLAALVAALCLAGALVAALAPTGQGCGSLAAPDFTDAEVRELAARFERVAEQTTGAARSDALSNRLEVMTLGAHCHEALGDRRTWTIGLGAGALVIPAGLLWVASGRRETTPTSTI